MESRKDDKESKESDAEADYEQREYSSPPCYLHEFEKQEAAAGQPPKKLKAAVPPKSDDAS